MHKTLATLAILFGFALAGCGDSDTPTVPSYSESAAPSESVPATVVDFRKDISDVRAVKADPMAYPEGKTFDLWFTITNHGGDASDYRVTFAVYDSVNAQIGAMLVDTSNDYAPVKPGAVLKVSGNYGTDFVIPNGASVNVESVDRIPVTPEGN